MGCWTFKEFAMDYQDLAVIRVYDLLGRVNIVNLSDISAFSNSLCFVFNARVGSLKKLMAYTLVFKETIDPILFREHSLFFVIVCEAQLSKRHSYCEKRVLIFHIYPIRMHSNSPCMRPIITRWFSLAELNSICEDQFYF